MAKKQYPVILFDCILYYQRGFTIKFLLIITCVNQCACIIGGILFNPSQNVKR